MLALISLGAVALGLARVANAPRRLYWLILVTTFLLCVGLLVVHPPSRPDWHVWGRSALLIAGLAVPIGLYVYLLKYLRTKATPVSAVPPEYILSEYSSKLTHNLDQEIDRAAQAENISLTTERFAITCRSQTRQTRAAGQVRLNRKSAEITHLWVAEGYRGKGHGRALADKLVAECRTRGANQITATIFDWQAAPFWFKLGFTEQASLALPDGHRRLILIKDLT